MDSHRRSEAEYRKERVHRLLVPALFLMVCTNPFYAVQFFAPMSSSCLEHYYHNATNKTADCLTWGGQVKSDSFFPTSFGRKLLGRFLHPDDFNYSQAWFCVYLFVYSQIMAFNFSNWHSKNGVDGFNSPMCCGKTNLDILKKPFSRLAKSLCCMCVFFLPSSNPGEFSKAIQTMFLGSFKLMLVPGAFLAFIEILLRWTPSVFASLILDWCNNVHFMFVYFMGYAIMAEDDHGIAKIMKKYRWMYLIIGTVLLQIYVAISLGAEQWFEGFYPHITPYILKCIFRGFGEWTFIIGLYSVNRHMCTRNYAIIRTLREMAMPFYLLHQQVLVVLVSGTLWVSYLGSFPATIILSTICTLIVSFLVVKSPDPVRYFFGLPSKHSIIPGEKLSGFLPLIGLCMLMVIESVVANLILRFAWKYWYHFWINLHVLLTQSNNMKNYIIRYNFYRLFFDVIAMYGWCSQTLYS